MLNRSQANKVAWGYRHWHRRTLNFMVCINGNLCVVCTRCASKGSHNQPTDTSLESWWWWWSHFENFIVGEAGHRAWSYNHAIIHRQKYVFQSPTFGAISFVSYAI